MIKEIDFNKNIPIYQQIVDYLKLQIILGEYPRGTQIPSIRDLATKLKVNPNTVQKAMTLLEQEGIIENRRTLGRYVTEEQSLIEQFKTNLIKKEINDFLNKMKIFNISLNEIKNFLEEDV